MFEGDTHFCRDFKRKGVDAGLFVHLFRESRNDLSIFNSFVLSPIQKIVAGCSQTRISEDIQHNSATIGRRFLDLPLCNNRYTIAAC